MPGYPSRASFDTGKPENEVRAIRADVRKEFSDNQRSRNAVKKGKATPINSPLKYTNKGTIRKRPKNIG